MKSNTTLVYDLGTGALSWGAADRRSDRYGAVMLMEINPGDPEQDLLRYESLLAGTRGTLSAKIIEVRKSGHIGDLFHGFQPGGAIQGEVLNLGVGTLFYETVGKYRVVGVQPDDGRDEFWLDPKLLYRAHECIVKLTFTPDVAG